VEKTYHMFSLICGGNDDNDTIIIQPIVGNSRGTAKEGEG
jgi:hypothetical protein